MNYSVKCLLFLLSSCLLLNACRKKQEDDGEELKRSQAEASTQWDGRTLFDDPSNPFLQPIPSSYQVHPNSAQMIDLIKSSCGNQFDNTYIVAKDYSTPVYIADENTGRADIKITLYNMPSGKNYLQSVPLVKGSGAAAGGDMHYSVIDKSTGCLYEFWGFQNNKAYSGNAISIHSNGIYADGRGTVAAGWSQLLGVIWPSELKNGLIDHALTFTVSVTDKNGYVEPATHNDGTLSSNPYAIPEGTLIRIRPDINIDTISGIGNTERTVYKAIQKYGMYCGDTNGAGLGIRAINTQSLTTDAYPSDFTLTSTHGTYVLKKFPFDWMEVVNAGPLKTNKGTYVEQSCASWR